MFETANGMKFDNIQDAIREEKKTISEYDAKADRHDKIKMRWIFSFWISTIIAILMGAILNGVGMIDLSFMTEGAHKNNMGLLIGVTILAMFFGPCLIPNGSDIHNSRESEINIDKLRRILVEDEVGGKINNGYVVRNRWLELTIEFDNNFQTVFAKIVKDKETGDERAVVKEFITA